MHPHHADGGRCVTLPIGINRNDPYALAKKRIRLAIDQKWRCCWCNHRMREELGFANSVTTEHVVPQVLGGPNERWNLMAACARCNHSRPIDMPWEDFEIEAKSYKYDTSQHGSSSRSTKRYLKGHAARLKLESTIKFKLTKFCMSIRNYIFRIRI